MRMEHINRFGEDRSQLRSATLRAVAVVSIAGIGLCHPSGAALAQSDDCSTATLNLGAGALRDYEFGSGSGRNVADLDALSADFEPYGISGTTVINNEWQRYQPFNDTNHHITQDRLELTALPDLGGVEPGGISSGQITTKETFYPSNGKTLVMQLRAKIPRGAGTWPAFWLYSPGGDDTTDSEIDIFEFFNNATQDTHDWTGYDHGAGVGADLCSIMTNEWVWHPGVDFADDYHTYTLVWREGLIEKWVDDTLVKRTEFTWYGPAPQILVNLAIGGNTLSDPTEPNTFPSVYSLDFLRVYEQ
jgi:beta-glucanase (GH16 family)